MARVEHGKHIIDLKRSTNADARKREEIVRRLTVLYAGEADPDLILYFRVFGRILTQTTHAECLPFSLTVDMSDEELIAAFKLFDGMDEAFTNAVWSTLNGLMEPVDLATGPEPLPENADPKA